jgi:hypothetical protein
MMIYHVFVCKQKLWSGASVYRLDPAPPPQLGGNTLGRLCGRPLHVTARGTHVIYSMTKGGRHYAGSHHPGP